MQGSEAPIVTSDTCVTRHVRVFMYGESPAKWICVSPASCAKIEIKILIMSGFSKASKIGAKEET